GPEYTAEVSAATVAVVPVSTSAVPVIDPLTRLPTQVETPPAASGREVPNIHSQVPAAEHTPPGHTDAAVHALPSFAPPTHCWKHGVLLAQTTLVLLVQRWLLMSPPGPAG